MYRVPSDLRLVNKFLRGVGLSIIRRSHVILRVSLFILTHVLDWEYFNSAPRLI